MDTYYFFEEELITKMHSSFISRFNLDHACAAELALEIIEMFKMSNTNLNELTPFYYQ
jgi:hypothetical protein